MKKEEILKAVHLLQSQNIVAIPTETVYGLAAGIFYPKAIQKIFTLKNRPQDNPLIAHVSDLSQVSKIAREIPDLFYLLAERFFPGPLTIVVKKHREVPEEVSRGNNTIAIRMPHHPIALEIIQSLGMPIVAPSANLSGRPSPTCAKHVKEDFGDQIPLVIDGGESEIGIESTVLSLVGEAPQILRPGIITDLEIEKVTGPLQKTSAQRVVSPGMKYKHYAPAVPIQLFESIHALKRYILKNPKKVFWILTYESLNMKNEKLFTEKTLYSIFRDAEEKVDEILIYLCSRLKEKKGLLDRVYRAAWNGHLNLTL